MEDTQRQTNKRMQRHGVEYGNRMNIIKRQRREITQEENYKDSNKVLK